MHEDTGIPVYTIHAEVEGMSKSKQFEILLERMIAEEMVFCSLRELIPNNIKSLPKGKIIRSSFLGREGWLACQKEV